YTLNLSGARGFFIGGIVEERADCRQTQVAAAGSDSAVLLQIVQESSNHGRIDLVKCQAGGRLVQMLLGELQQQAKGVAIGTNGMRTRLPLIHQAVSEELFQQRGERDRGLHDCFSQYSSNRLTASPINSGQALRYQ